MEKEEPLDCLPASHMSETQPEDWSIEPIIPSHYDRYRAPRNETTSKGCGFPVDATQYEKIVHKDIRRWLQESMAWLHRQKGIDLRTKDNCFMVLALMREHAEWRSAWSCYGFYAPYVQLSYKRIAEEVGFCDDPRWTHKRTSLVFHAIACSPEEFERGAIKPLLIVRRAYHNPHGGQSWAKHYALIRPLSEDIGGDINRSLSQSLVGTESSHFRDSRQEGNEELCEADVHNLARSNELAGVPKAPTFDTCKTGVGSIESSSFGYSQESLEVPKVPLGSSTNASRRFRKLGLQGTFPLTIPLSNPAPVSPASAPMRRGADEPTFRGEQSLKGCSESQSVRGDGMSDCGHNSKKTKNIYSRYR